MVDREMADKALAERDRMCVPAPVLAKALAYLPPAGTILCREEALRDPGAAGFLYGAGTEQVDLFVVHKDGLLRAYLNACPHIGTPLETLTDRFLTQDNKMIMCSTHGAQFTIENGLCVAGPCKGRTLLPIAIEVAGGDIRLADNSGV